MHEVDDASRVKASSGSRGNNARGQEHCLAKYEEEASSLD
jgi:hypothetical protein